MTRLEKRQQRKAIQAEYANGMSRTALAVKYGVSRMSISRSLMSDDAYNRMIDQAQARKERVELRIGSKGDRLLAMLKRIHGEPREDIAPELQKMRYA